MKSRAKPEVIARPDPDGCDRVNLVQPAEVLDWFQRYISVDDRFALDVAGSLKGGSIIWATATYRDPLVVAGDKHVARVLMSTTFDGSGATINQATTTRVVCNNTLRMAHSDNKSMIRTRHNTKFDAARVGKELAQLAKGFAEFKTIGDAMAATELSKEYVQNFFKHCLDIPLDAKQDDISTRKMNQFRAVSTAYSITRRERGVADQKAPADAWQVLQAITRWVDHDRTSINGDRGEKQFTSANFGSGDAVKGKAMGMLLPLVRAKVTA
jgi:phage/plasmid-like protein (TIGR03299 family)